jgi:hypothetical protein
VENNVIIVIAFSLSRIAQSSKGLSVAILRGKRTMSMREEDGKGELESGLHCLVVQPHVKEKQRVKCVIIGSCVIPGRVKSSGLGKVLQTRD